MESHKAAQAQADAELAQVAERAAKLHAAATADIARERAAAETDLVDHARELAIEICRRLLARLPSSVTLAAFVEGLCAEIRNLPPQMRPADDDELEVKTAAPVTAEAAENMRGALAAAFGRAHLLTLRADPAVIAGIELRTPHALMCNSWRADLKRISEELKHDRDQPGDTRGLARTG
jgi:F-type H+-transporting ATPase subunit b